MALHLRNCFFFAFLACSMDAGYLPHCMGQSAQGGNALQGDVSSLTHASYEGFSEAISDVEVSTDEVGQLIEVPARLGQTVSVGQVIAQLDDRAQVAAVQVSHAQAKMEGEIKSAEANLALQAYRVEQLRALSQKNMAGPEELRRAEMELAIANARVQMAKEEKELRRTEQARLELQVELRKIRAPFDGIIATKRLDSGDAVTPGNAAIVRLIRTDTLIGVFNVPAEHSFLMRPEMAVQVYFRAARRTVDAKIDSISPAINGESGTVMVRVAIANADNELHVGDRLSMRVTPGQPINSTPQSRPEGKLSTRPTTLGQSTNR